MLSLVTIFLCVFHCRQSWVSGQPEKYLRTDSGLYLQGTTLLAAPKVGGGRVLWTVTSTTKQITCTIYDSFTSPSCTVGATTTVDEPGIKFVIPDSGATGKWKLPSRELCLDCRNSTIDCVIDGHICWNNAPNQLFKRQDYSTGGRFKIISDEHEGKCVTYMATPNNFQLTPCANSTQQLFYQD